MGLSRPKSRLAQLKILNKCSIKLQRSYILLIHILIAQKIRIPDKADDKEGLSLLLLEIYLSNCFQVCLSFSARP